MLVDILTDLYKFGESNNILIAVFKNEHNIVSVLDDLNGIIVNSEKLDRHFQDTNKKQKSFQNLSTQPLLLGEQWFNESYNHIS